MHAQSICKKLEQRQQGSPMSSALYSVTGILQCPLLLPPPPRFQAAELWLSNAQPRWRLQQFWGDSGVLQQPPSLCRLLQHTRVEEVV